MSTENAVMVYLTFPSEQSALEIGRLLIKERSAACFNLLGAIRSLYSWQGDLCEETEYAAFAKTTSAQMERLRNTVLTHHPAQVPCILVLPVESETSHPPFLNWITEQTQ